MPLVIVSVVEAYVVTLRPAPAPAVRGGARTKDRLAPLPDQG